MNNNDLLFNTIAEIANPSINYRVMPLEAIRVEKPLQTSTERTVRITEGHFVYVDGSGNLQDVTKENKENFRITGCYGTIQNTELHFVTINLKDLSLIKIEV